MYIYKKIYNTMYVYIYKKTGIGGLLGANILPRLVDLV